MVLTKYYWLEFKGQMVGTKKGSFTPIVFSITAGEEVIEISWLFTK